MTKNNLKCEKLLIFISDEAIIENGVVLEPNITIKGGSHIYCGAKIGSNSIIENSVIKENAEIKSSIISDSIIGKNAKIGPWAHLRNNAIIGNDCRIGNFVEIKNSNIGDKTKIAHLTYIGDASVGQDCNIGCGVVFCNYDGKEKHHTIVGDKSFIGSNVNLIAPVKLGEKSFVAAGSTINKDIADNGFAIARARQESLENVKNRYLENFEK